MNQFKIRAYIIDKITESGVPSYLAENLVIILLFLVSLFIGGILFWVSRKIIIGFFRRITLKTKSSFDDLLIKNRVPRILSYLPVLFLFYGSIPSIFDGFNDLLFKFSKNVLEALFIIVIIGIVRAILKTLTDYLKTVPSFKDKPLDSYLQVFMIFLWFIGGILILSVLTGKDIGTFLTTLGALSAVLLFVFKDTILGLVASVQITVNDTVRIGDWISIPSSNADGDVISISLSTVQVQNFDMTITSIPTYKLISDSFINWRGMSESQGRRIKRSLLIKISSIRFLNSDDILALDKIEILAPFLQKRKNEIESFNQEINTDKSLLINGRNLTNIGLFRHYTEAYLKEHPMVNTKMTAMCRQLSPTSQGIPLEVYVFSADKDWVNYEHISADIFDHLIASTKYFNLECFELSPQLPIIK